LRGQCDAHIVVDVGQNSWLKKIDGIANQLFSVVIAKDIKNYRMDGMAGKVVLK
jgi:hypothetical protein